MEDVEKLDQSWSNWAGNDGGDRALDALRDCLHGLGARARKALEMRFRKDCTREEIAQSLGFGGGWGQEPHAASQAETAGVCGREVATG
ncbi:MAG: hypothetical protein U0894_11225 [Pirellulales bacterium]